MDTNIDRNEFHAFLVAFRHYLEVAYVFEELDSSQDRRLSYREAKRGMDLFEKWTIESSEVRRQFPADEFEDALEFPKFAEWIVRRRVGSLELPLNDSDADEVVKEAAAAAVRGA